MWLIHIFCVIPSFLRFTSFVWFTSFCDSHLLSDSHLLYGSQHFCDPHHVWLPPFVWFPPFCGSNIFCDSVNIFLVHNFVRVLVLSRSDWFRVIGIDPCFWMIFLHGCLCSCRGMFPIQEMQHMSPLHLRPRYHTCHQQVIIEYIYPLLCQLINDLRGVILFMGRSNSWEWVVSW